MNKLILASVLTLSVTSASLAIPDAYDPHLPLDDSTDNPHTLSVVLNILDESSVRSEPSFQTPPTMSGLAVHDTARIDMTTEIATQQTLNLVNSGLVSPAAGAIGAVGGALIANAISEGLRSRVRNKDSQNTVLFNAAIDLQNYSASSHFQETLTQRLEQAGYELSGLTVIHLDEEMSAEDALQRQHGNNPPADAVLSILLFQHGLSNLYSTAPEQTPWRTDAKLFIHMYNSNSGELELQDFITYQKGDSLYYVNGVLIESQTGYNMSSPYFSDGQTINFETLASDQAQVSELIGGLNEMHEDMADQIVHLITPTRFIPVSAQ